MNDGNEIPRLGILAATFSDGSLRVLLVPHPEIFKTRVGHSTTLYGTNKTTTINDHFI